jgi:hypothetical protein
MHTSDTLMPFTLAFAIWEQARRVANWMVTMISPRPNRMQACEGGGQVGAPSSRLGQVGGGFRADVHTICNPDNDQCAGLSQFSQSHTPTHPEPTRHMTVIMRPAQTTCSL